MKKFLIYFILTNLLIIKLIGGSYLLSYGSRFEDGQTHYYANQWGQRLTLSTPGLIAVGYFDTGFDPSESPQFLKNHGIESLISHFNVLDSISSSEAQSSSGYIFIERQVDGIGAGNDVYILHLAGTTSSLDLENVSGIGIYTDSAFSPLPNTSDILPTEYFLDTVSYDTVIIGDSKATDDPVNGFVYIPFAINSRPLALSDSIQLSDTWWSSNWFGVFSVHPNSPWIYHPSYGWVYPDSTNSTGLWFYEPTQYGWLFTSSTTYPNIWSDSLQKWLYLNEDSPSVSFWIWNSDTSNWELP